MSRFSFALKPFDVESGALMADAALTVYESQPVATRWACDQFGADRFRFLDVRNVQAFLAGTDQWNLLSFRGTEANCLNDWLTDMGMSLVPGPLQSRVHVGFYEALSHVWRDIEDTLAEWQGDAWRPLWITGHSLGGALATLAAARWLEQGRLPHAIYTFGQPRVGDGEFARNFNFLFKNRCFRIVNDRDLVTRVPPRSLGYSHLGTFKMFTADGQLVDDIAWWDQFLRTWSTAFRDFVGWACESVDDHRMVHYHRLFQQELSRMVKAMPVTSPLRRSTSVQVPARSWRMLREACRLAGASNGLLDTALRRAG